jgi:hypothetical protein
MNEGKKEGSILVSIIIQLIQFSTFQSSPSFSLYYIMMLERTYVHEVKKNKYEELVVSQVGKYKYLVYNRMKDTAYYVNVTYTGRFTWFSCECKAFEFNKGRCKHIDAVKQFISDQEIEEMSKNIAVENTAELIDFKD